MHWHIYSPDCIFALGKTLACANSARSVVIGCRKMNQTVNTSGKANKEAAKNFILVSVACLLI